MIFYFNFQIVCVHFSMADTYSILTEWVKQRGLKIKKIRLLLYRPMHRAPLETHSRVIHLFVALGHQIDKWILMYDARSGRAIPIACEEKRAESNCGFSSWKLVRYTIQLIQESKNVCVARKHCHVRIQATVHGRTYTAVDILKRVITAMFETLFLQDSSKRTAFFECAIWAQQTKHQRIINGVHIHEHVDTDNYFIFVGAHSHFQKFVSTPSPSPPQQCD